MARPGGRVNVTCTVEDGKLHLDWEESGGPPVLPPRARGFGSKLIEGLIDDLGGQARIDYAPASVRCEITAPL
jgi:chemotaxis family two-component system sensor kinase Cph1